MPIRPIRGRAWAPHGYTRVTDHDSGAGADLAVAVSVYSNDHTGIISYDDYGGYYGDYWDPYY